jgi:hypothetical protein
LDVNIKLEAQQKKLKTIRGPYTGLPTHTCQKRTQKILWHTPFKDCNCASRKSVFLKNRIQKQCDQWPSNRKWLLLFNIGFIKFIALTFYEDDMLSSILRSINTLRHLERNYFLPGWLVFFWKYSAKQDRSSQCEYDSRNT